MSFSGFIRLTASRNSGVLPVRGGSRKTTSTRSPLATILTDCFVASSFRKCALWILLSLVFWIAHRWRFHSFLHPKHFLHSCRRKSDCSDSTVCIQNCLRSIETSSLDRRPVKNLRLHRVNLIKLEAAIRNRIPQSSSTI